MKKTIFVIIIIISIMAGYYLYSKPKQSSRPPLPIQENVTVDKLIPIEKDSNVMTSGYSGKK